MRSSKFLITFCLIAVMVLCLVTVMPTVAFAGESGGVTPEDGDISVTIPGATGPENSNTASGTCGKNLTWTLNASGTLTIRGTGTMDSYMEIPTPWADYAELIKTVTISTNVTSIGDNAFAGCEELLRITIPKTVTSIGYSAFEGCDSLVAITLPENITTIGMNAFAYTSLLEITIPEGITAIEYGTFKKCAELVTVYMPSTVEAIDSYAFDGCASLKDVYLYGEDLISATYTIAEGNDPFLEANWLIMLEDDWYYIPELKSWIYIKDYAPVTGWQTIGGVRYYFDENGLMQTGWLSQGGKWYYLHSGGNMATGWAKVGGVYYYLNAQGVMQTGWVQTGGVWYYMNSSGAMVTGWKQVGGVWYYFKSSGAMATGWLKLGSTWYYFKSGGAMVTGSLKIGSKTYRFNSSGACLNP